MHGIAEGLDAAKPGRAPRRASQRHDGVNRRSRALTPRPAVEGAARRAAPCPIVPSEIAILDEAGRIVVVNEAWRQTVVAFGLSLRDCGEGATYVEVAAKFLPHLNREGLSASLRDLLSGVVQEVRYTFAIQTPVGARWRQVQITALPTGGPGRFVAIHDDRTELAAAQEALKVTTGQLLAARDEERRRIALELHDSTSQHLAAISLNVARLRRGGGYGEREAATLDEIGRSVAEAVKETRVLAYLMNPRGLGDHGLRGAVLQFLEGFARRTGLEVACESEAAVDGVAPDLQHAALRIVQEALLNAHRHAQARRVRVEIRIDHALLTVSVADDGRGLAAEAQLGVGIPGMQARAQQYAGDFAISSDEAGTRVVARLPLA